MNIQKHRRIWQLYIFFSILSFLLVAISGGVLMVLYDNMAELGRIISSAAIIALAWVLIAVLYNFVKRSNLIIWGFILIYIAGIINYKGVEFHPENLNTKVENGVSILAPINHTLSMFFPSRGSYQEENHQETLIRYHIVHLLSYFFFALIAFSLFGRRIMNRSGHYFISYRHKNLFWGYSETGHVVATSIQNSTIKDQAVFILSKEIRQNQDEDNRIFNEINRIDSIALYVDDSKLSHFKRSLSGHRHFFLTEDQDKNVGMALRVLDILIEGKTPIKTHLYVMSEREHIDRVFEEKWKELNDAGKETAKYRQRIEIHICNHSDLTARLFVSQNPIVKHKALSINHSTCTVSGRFNILLLGLGSSGLELLRKTICDAQFLGDDYHFSITVIDRDYTLKHGRYKYIFEEAIEKEVFDIQFNPNRIEEANSIAFYDWLAEDKRIYSFDRIIVAMGDDCLNINTAMELTNFRLRYFDGNQYSLKEKIFAHVRNTYKYEYYQQNNPQINLFGGLNATNASNILIDECMDRIAKMVNYVYSRYDIDQFVESEFEKIVAQWEPIELAWADASLFNQNSSRALALNINNMIWISGGESEFEKKIRVDHFLELFAEYEHLRWNAFHYINGIQCWNMDEVKSKNGKLLVENALLKHICLIPYDDLDNASRKVNSFRNPSDLQENYKNSDRRIVRHFPLFLRHKQS